MPTRITVVNGIIITIAIEVKSVYGFEIEVVGIIRGNESSPFRRIISCVEVIEVCVFIVVITTVSDRIGVFTP